jgi:hypothetical protein
MHAGKAHGTAERRRDHHVCHRGPDPDDKAVGAGWCTTIDSLRNT